MPLRTQADVPAEDGVDLYASVVAGLGIGCGRRRGRRGIGGLDVVGGRSGQGAGATGRSGARRGTLQLPGSAEPHPAPRQDRLPAMPTIKGGRLLMS